MPRPAPPPALRPVPLLLAGVLVVLGCLSWLPLGRPAPAPLLAAAAALGLLGALAPRRALAWCALGPALVLLGLGRAALVPAPPPATVATAGLIGEVVAVSGIRTELETPAGRLRVDRWPAPALGSVVAVRGPAATVAPGLSGSPRAGALDLRRGARAIQARWWRTLSAPAADGPSPLDASAHAGMLRALARGQRAGLSDATRGLLRRTGTAHLLAISGLHIGLVAGLAWGLGRLLASPFGPTAAWRTTQLVPAGLAVATAAAYAGLVGWPPSAARAVLMVAGATLAALLGRRPDPGALLGGAALLLSLAEPASPASLGFQLSFLAVAGILLTAPLAPPRRWPAALRLPLAALRVTVGASLGTLPVVAWQLQELSWTAPLANLLVTPLVGTVVVPGALLCDRSALLAGLLLPLVDGALTVALGTLALLDRPPLHPALGPLGAVLLAAVLPLLRAGLADALLVGSLVFGLGTVPAGVLQVDFLDIGQGDAALVRWPDGDRWLVDGGPPGDELLRWLRRQGIHRLEAVALSHAHPDHHGGLLPVLAALPVDELWLPRRPVDPDDPLLVLWRAGLAAGATVRLPQDGGPVREGLSVLHPRPGFQPRARRRVNNESLVLVVAHAGRRVLLTGDIEDEAEAWLAPHLGPVDVVKAPHHGSRSSSTPALVAATRPAWVVVSCGRGNRFGHPHPAALARWQGSRWARTDQDGTIRVRLGATGLTVAAVDWWGRARPLRRQPWRPRPPDPAQRATAGARAGPARARP